MVSYREAKGYQCYRLPDRPIKMAEQSSFGQTCLFSTVAILRSIFYEMNRITPSLTSHLVHNDMQ